MEYYSKIYLTILSVLVVLFLYGIGYDVVYYKFRNKQLASISWLAVIALSLRRC